MSKKSNYWWTKLSDEELLELRFCDLNLDFKKAKRLRPCIKRLYKELSDKNIKLRPHFWISDEWFSADGVPGIALPFYLMHERLSELHTHLVYDIEGATSQSLMKLLRHETAHALDNAFYLRKNRQRQKVFGLSSNYYPESYRPKKHYKNYVKHLNPWYAQSHPDEDWAETFAVWLDPKSKWKKDYKNWPVALSKLELLDELMNKIKGQKPKVHCREKPGSIIGSTKKLKTFYRHRLSSPDEVESFDLKPVIEQVFSTSPSFKSNKLARVFLKKERLDLAKTVGRWTGQDVHTMSLIIDKCIQVCEEKNLRLRESEKQSRVNLVALLTAYSMNSIYSNKHSIYM